MHFHSSFSTKCSSCAFYDARITTHSALLRQRNCWLIVIVHPNAPANVHPQNVNLHRLFLRVKSAFPEWITTPKFMFHVLFLSRQSDVHVVEGFASLEPSHCMEYVPIFTRASSPLHSNWKAGPKQHCHSIWKVSCCRTITVLWSRALLRQVSMPLWARSMSRLSLLDWIGNYKSFKFTCGQFIVDKTENLRQREIIADSHVLRQTWSVPLDAFLLQSFLMAYSTSRRHMYGSWSRSRHSDS
jgi:hypothetical protein